MTLCLCSGYPDLDGENKPGMKQVGGLTLVAPALAGGRSFAASQHPANGTVALSLGGKQGTLELKTFAHATEPLLITELTLTPSAGISLAISNGAFRQYATRPPQVLPPKSHLQKIWGLLPIGRTVPFL